MELTAAIKALNALGNTRLIPVILYSNSQLLINGMTQWLPNWLANGWRTTDKTPVKNVDLWQELEALSSGLHIDWRWVRGHNGDPHNEEVDMLANQAAQSCPST